MFISHFLISWTIRAVPDGIDFDVFVCGRHSALHEEIKHDICVHLRGRSKGGGPSSIIDSYFCFVFAAFSILIRLYGSNCMYFWWVKYIFNFIYVGLKVHFVVIFWYHVQFLSIKKLKCMIKKKGIINYII